MTHDEAEALGEPAESRAVLPEPPKAQKTLLERAVDDRARRPWNYYRLDHDTMKRMLNEMADKLVALSPDTDTAPSQENDR